MICKISHYIDILNSNDKSAIETIQLATKDEDLFNFVELLENQKIVELKSKGAEEAMFYALLELFSFGTYDEYKQESSKFPRLSVEQLEKLRQLTMVSASMTSSVIDYTDLCKMTGLTSCATMEALLRRLMQSGVVGGYFDQERRQFHVRFTSGRDFSASRVSEVRSKLIQRADKCDEVVERLAVQFSAANAAKSQHRLESQQTAAALHKAREDMLLSLRKDSHDKAAAAVAAGAGSQLRAASGTTDQATLGSGSSMLRPGLDGPVSSQPGNNGGHTASAATSAQGNSNSHFTLETTKTGRKGLLRTLKKK